MSSKDREVREAEKRTAHVRQNLENREASLENWKTMERSYL